MEDDREAAEERGDCLRGQEWAHPRPGKDHPLPRPADQAEAPPGVYWQGQSLLAKVFFTLRSLGLYQAFSWLFETKIKGLIFEWIRLGTLLISGVISLILSITLAAGGDWREWQMTGGQARRGRSDYSVR